MDGNNIQRLTEDKTSKTNLHWSLDGQAVQYISGQCVFSVRLVDGGIDTIFCLNFIQYLKSFEVSPDGTQAALSLDNQLYIIPYDVARLNEVKTRGELAAMATCKDWAPYERNFVKLAHWSQDGKQLAMVIFGVAEDIGSADIVQIISLEECTPSPKIIDNFPPPRFRPPDYVTSPTIPDFGWDGLNLFSINTFVRNNGFGDLFIYNSELKKARSEINPIDGQCCYRDSRFSPDGNHLFFVFQDTTRGVIRFYIVPYGTIGTGLSYEPIPYIEIPGISSSPVPVLRPAQP
jgi:hypothetical protein